MKMQDKRILCDIQKISDIGQEFDLSSQKEVDTLYKQLKRQKENEFYSWVGKAFYRELKKKTTYAKRRRRAAFCIRQIETVVFLTAFFLLGIGAAYKMKEYEDEVLQEVLWEVKAAGKHENSDVAQSESQPEPEIEMPAEQPKPEILAEYRQFYNLNPDFVGWIVVQGTDIDYPVLQNRETPEFYLSHNFLKEEQRSGSVFLDGQANIYPKDGNIVLYGHNMGDGTIFGSLKKYKDESFYKEHAEFEFDTCYEKSLYQIVAIVVTDISDTEGFCYYEFRNHDRSEFRQCVEFIAENQLYETGIQMEYGDEIVMLSTCESSSKNSRLIVIGKRIKD